MGLVITHEEQEEEEEGVEGNEEQEGDEEQERVCIGLAIENKLSSSASEQRTVRQLKASILILFGQIVY